MPSISYEKYLIESLKDPEEAIGYLDACLEGGSMDVFLLALRDVVKANGGVAALAKKAEKGRTSLYKTLSETGNPCLKSVMEILAAVNMRLHVAPAEASA